MAFESLNFTHGKIALLKRSIKQGKGRTFTLKLGCLVKKVSEKRNIQRPKHSPEGILENFVKFAQACNVTEKRRHRRCFSRNFINLFLVVVL